MKNAISLFLHNFLLNYFSNCIFGNSNNTQKFKKLCIGSGKIIRKWFASEWLKYITIVKYTRLLKLIAWSVGSFNGSLMQLSQLEFGFDLIGLPIKRQIAVG